MEGKSMTTWQNKKGFQKIWWRLKSKTGEDKIRLRQEKFVKVSKRKAKI